MKKIIFHLAALFYSVLTFPQSNSAGKVYINAKIWTGDGSHKDSKAIAIKDNKIVYIGNDYSSFITSATIVIDLKDKLLIPGFIDNHTHFLNGGYNLSGVQLRYAKDPADFIRILKEFCLQHPDDRWIQGGDWDHENWGGELPKKEWIDSVTGNHPLFVNRYDGHMAFANSKALKLAGITKDTKVSAGGEIVRDKNGEPTGVLKDDAMGPMYRVIPADSETEMDEYFRAAAEYALSNGVTQVHDMGSYGGWIDLGVYKKAYKENRLPLRIYSFIALGRWKAIDSVCKKDGRGDDMLRWGGMKGFVDGSLGSTTAWFYQAYLDAPDKTGLQVTDTATLRRWVMAADSCGLHVAVHAIGDRANDFILRVYAEAEKKNPNKDHRFRIEHAQHLTQNAIQQFAKLKVIPSMQPYHAIDDGKWAYKRLDDARLKGTYAFKSLLDAKANLTFGSDWPVAPATPLEGIYAAVTRRTLDDKNPDGWYPEQKISVEQALKCYTANNAYAGFQENKLGVLREGMLADFVVLSEDLFKIAPEKIKEVKVLRTIVNGVEVFTFK